MSEFAPLTELFTPELKITSTASNSNTVSNPDPKDQAELITEVYTDLGIFNSATAEQAPELLAPQIEALYLANPDTALKPFLQINLTPAFGLITLLHNFDKIQFDNPSTWISKKIWDQYDLSALNSRRTYGHKEPTPGLVRGHVLSPAENDVSEPGLVHTNKTTTMQRQLAVGQTLLNITDYIAIQAMSRETDKRLLGPQTVTSFPQLPENTLDGDVFCVGNACWNDGRLYLGGSDEHAFRFVGVRVSLGIDKA